MFLGSRKDPENFYPALDIVALTSLNEGTPLSLIEAMANERPVIATAVGGVVDLSGRRSRVHDGFHVCERGLLVEARDAETFAAGLALLIATSRCAVKLRRARPRVCSRELFERAAAERRIKLLYLQAGVD